MKLRTPAGSGWPPPVLIAAGALGAGPLGSRAIAAPAARATGTGSCIRMTRLAMLRASTSAGSLGADTDIVWISGALERASSACVPWFPSRLRSVCAGDGPGAGAAGWRASTGALRWATGARAAVRSGLMTD